MTETPKAKARLRESVLARREALAPETRSALSRKILLDVVALTAYQGARTVLAYAGFGNELNTDAFLRHTLDEAKTLLLPSVNRQTKRLDIYVVRDPARDLRAGTWGIREPVPDRCELADSNSVDFVLVPGLAFDARGGRLGYGAGFYDRLLSGSMSPLAWLVAGAFEAQMVQQVPMTEHDVPVDLVVTEKGNYPPGTPRRRTRTRPE